MEEKLWPARGAALWRVSRSGLDLFGFETSALPVPGAGPKIRSNGSGPTAVRASLVAHSRSLKPLKRDADSSGVVSLPRAEACGGGKIFPAIRGASGGTSLER